jgi:streptogramin lyase
MKKSRIVSIVIALSIVIFMLTSCGSGGWGDLQPKKEPLPPFNTSSLPLTVTDGSPVFSFAFDGKGNLLFIAEIASELRSFDRSTGTVNTVATGLPGSSWRGIAYQDSNSIFVGAENGNIYKVDPTTGSTTTLITVSGGAYINCLAIAPTTFTPYGGQLIAASNTGIYAIDQSLASPTVTQISNMGGSMASSLVFGSDGTLYVALEEDDKIVTMTAVGVATDFATGLSGPDGLAIDNNAGLLYVTNDKDATIKSVTIPGGTVSTFATGLSFSYGWAPTPIIVDATSNILLVGDYSSGSLTIDYFALP